MRKLLVLFIFCLLCGFLSASPLIQWTWKGDSDAKYVRYQLDDAEPMVQDSSVSSLSIPLDNERHVLFLSQSFDGENWSDPSCFYFHMESSEEPTTIRWTWWKSDESVAFFRCTLDDEEPMVLDGATTSFEIPFDGKSHTLSIAQSYDGIHWGEDVAYTLNQVEGFVSSYSPDILSSSRYSAAATVSSTSILHDWFGFRVLSDWQFGDYESTDGWIPNSMLAYPGFGLGLGWRHELSSSFAFGLETSFLYRGTKKGSPYTIVMEEGTAQWQYLEKDGVSLSFGTTLGATYSSCLGLGSFGYTAGLNHALSFAVSDEASVSLKTKLYAIQEIFENGRLSTVFAIQPLVLTMDVRL